MRNLIIPLSLYFLCIIPAFAHDAALKDIHNAQKVGTGRFSVVLWDVYDATLYAPDGKWDENAPYALTIHYLREIEGAHIADRSVKEMRKQGFTDEARLAVWNSQMHALFPDVKNGTELTAVFIPGKPTDFYQGDTYIGRIEDASFGKHFSDIWLSEKTSEPALRKKLLGLL